MAQQAGFVLGLSLGSYCSFALRSCFLRFYAFFRLVYVLNSSYIRSNLRLEILCPLLLLFFRPARLAFLAPHTSPLTGVPYISPGWYKIPPPPLKRISVPIFSKTRGKHKPTIAALEISRRNISHPRDRSSISPLGDLQLYPLQDR